MSFQDVFNCLLTWPCTRIDAKAVKLAIEANQRDEESSRSAVAKFGVNRRPPSALTSEGVSVVSAGQFKNQLTPGRVQCSARAGT